MHKRTIDYITSQKLFNKQEAVKRRKIWFKTPPVKLPPFVDSNKEIKNNIINVWWLHVPLTSTKAGIVPPCVARDLNIDGSGRGFVSHCIRTAVLTTLSTPATVSRVQISSGKYVFSGYCTDYSQTI